MFEMYASLALLALLIILQATNTCVRLHQL
jgi:hypothetical protein